MIVIVGAGPSGMMAAISASSAGCEVTLVEKNDSLGKKLLLTGGARCNLTNMCEAREMVGHFAKTGDFLRDAFKAFGNKELLAFFAARGLVTKIEENGRVFPVTNKARSVLDVLKKELDRLKVRILLKKGVKDVLLERGVVKGIICADGSIIESDKVILAAGGVSYKTTGSAGDGIRMAEKMGHKIVPLKPGLVPLILGETYPKGLQGLSLDARLTFKCLKSSFVSKRGALLFTGKGISGPITFDSEAKAIDWMTQGKKVSVYIDIVPGINPEELGALLACKLTASSGKIIKNILKEIIPAGLADIIPCVAKISSQKKAGQITVKERKTIVSVLKGLSFDVDRSGSFEEAQITVGGVSVKDIDPKTMASKKIKGLGFAGEMIDIAGDCGGFNLQAAFSTGYLAGTSNYFNAG